MFFDRTLIAVVHFTFNDVVLLNNFISAYIDPIVRIPLVEDKCL